MWALFTLSLHRQTSSLPLRLWPGRFVLCPRASKNACSGSRDGACAAVGGSAARRTRAGTGAYFLSLCFFFLPRCPKYSECFVIYMTLPKCLYFPVQIGTCFSRGYLAYGRLCRYQVRGCYHSSAYQALSGWKPLVIVMKPTKSPSEGQPNPRKGNIVSGAIMRV